MTSTAASGTEVTILFTGGQEYRRYPCSHLLSSHLPAAMPASLPPTGCPSTVPDTTSYYRGDGALWVKLVVENTGANTGPGGGTNIEVSR